MEVVSAPNDVVLHNPRDLLLDALRQAGHGLEPDHPVSWPRLSRFLTRVSVTFYTFCIFKIDNLQKQNFAVFFSSKAAQHSSGRQISADPYFSYFWASCQ